VSAVRDLVLVGGGHAHVQVVRRWMMRPLPDVRLTLVVDRPDAVYSGMVPGFVAGDYQAHELEIDVVPLARRARARVVLTEATGIDPVARHIVLAGRPPLPYDIASLDVGSTVRGLDLPGVREHALATRPIRRFVDRLDVRLAEACERAGSEPVRVTVVGGGVAGMELAFTLEARIRRQGRPARVTVLTDGPRILPGHPERVVTAVLDEAKRRRIRVRRETPALAVEPDAVVLDSERVPSELVVWATGAAAPALVSGAPLSHDDAGFVLVRGTLQVVGHDDLFAVGDCAALATHRWVPKAGVYAVRQGPVLDANLRARLQGGTLRTYTPQRDYLALLNLGDRRALGTKWGRAVSGTTVWRLKDWIDRRFVRRFQVLASDASPAPTFPSPESMGLRSADMTCGGCAAKLGAPALERALARLAPAPADPSVHLGLDHPDDAAAMLLPKGDVLLATIDAFRAFTDDPWLVGRVAAVNAASDVLAKGGRPRHALALVTLPDADDPARSEELLYEVLTGVRAGLDPLGVSLVGGHTTTGPELFVGLALTGEIASTTILLAASGARPGHQLILTKALGTGVVLAADMQGRAPGRAVAAAFVSMLRPNLDAAAVARRVAASACTDVSGFGLAGHLRTMLRDGRMTATVRVSALPAIEGAVTLFGHGLQTTFHAQNRRPDLAIAPTLAGNPTVELMFDPQTSGGLLLSVGAARAAEAVRLLHDAGDGAACVIGELRARRDGDPLVEVVPEGTP
jgi:selenide,water dikinase